MKPIKTSTFDSSERKGFSFGKVEVDGYQPNAAPSIREIINKFRIGIPIGQYMRPVEYGDYLDPTARPDFDFEKADQIRRVQDIMKANKAKYESKKKDKDPKASPEPSKTSPAPSEPPSEPKVEPTP